MQKRELNTYKQDIYSLLHFLLPTNPRLCGAGDFHSYCGTYFTPRILSLSEKASYSARSEAIRSRTD